MKFGGAAVASPKHFSKIADVILQRMREFDRVIIVVSAMGKTTDDLIKLATEVNPDPPTREYDMLVSVGERISISLLAMALAAKAQDAVSFTGSQSGIITTETHTNARILDVRPHRLINSLNAGKIVIVAGFQGVSLKGEITTLGRGGSDTTAVALGVAFGAKVEFYKDVPGICSNDPKLCSEAFVYPSLTHLEALDIVAKGAKVLHPRCIELAFRNQLPLHVLPFEDFDPLAKKGTVISSKSLQNAGSPCYETEDCCLKSVFLSYLE